MGAQDDDKIRSESKADASPKMEGLRALCACGARSQRRASSGCCTPVRDTPLERPDLAIYSQQERIAAGAEPSWDSPDIVTNNWSPFRLLEEARITVRNLSPSTAAVNGVVHYYTSPFGIGTRRQLRLSQMVNLGPAQQAQLVFPLHQEVLSGDPRVGVHIVIEHPHDADPVNNAGSQVHDGAYTSESGRSFDVQIPVLNDSPEARQIDLAILSTDLVATLSVSSRLFAPFEQINTTLHIDVPAFLAGSSSGVINRAVTVVGRVAATGELLGGVTRLVRIDN